MKKKDVVRRVKNVVFCAAAVFLTLNLKVVNINAKEDYIKIESSQGVFSNPLVSSDDLLQGYLDQELFCDPVTFSVTRNASSQNTGVLYSKLNANEKSLYNALKKDADQVARGLLSSSVFTYTLSQFTYDGDWDKLVKEVVSGINFEKLIYALRLESPYEFYWCGLSYQCSIGLDAKAQHPTYIVYFSVGKEYVKKGASVAWEEPTIGKMYTDVNTTKTGATTEAINNAKIIVKEFANESDYDKLQAYKDAICDLVSYDFDALNLPLSDYGNPWQLIYVFDGDSSTNVVCEGYAKAFKYLCDMTSFQNIRIKCHLVEGTMQGGAHMWNVVTMDDNMNYLVDVTNCDAGMVGAPDSLFLTNASSGSASGTYTVYGMNYKYSPQVKTDYGTDANSVITLSKRPYQTPDKGEDILDELVVSGSLKKAKYICTDSFDKTGLKLLAVYTNGNTKDVSANVTFDSNIKAGQKSVVFSYTEKGVTRKASVDISVKHSEKSIVENTVTATSKKDGKIVTKCTVCNEEIKKTVIKKIKTATLKYTSTVYTGKALKPAVTVKDSAGKTINAKYYTVKYSNNKAVGTATVTIAFKTNYSGTIKKTFSIVPKATTVSKVTPASKKLTVTVKKQATQTTGYQIQVATDKKFTKNVKNVTIGKNTTLSKALTGLKAKTPYYIRVRTYKVVNKKNVYSSWSVYKNVVKTK